MAKATTWNGLKIAPRLRWKIRYRLIASGCTGARPALFSRPANYEAAVVALSE